VNVEADNVDLQKAFSLVLQKAGVNYVIHPDVPFTKVTLGLNNVPLQIALKLLCKKSEIPLYCDNRQGIYRIAPVPSANPGEWKEHSGRMWVHLGMKDMRLGAIISLMMEQLGELT
jgi:hypothetical protein